MASKRRAFLVVDDEQAICDLLCDVLTEQGYTSEAVNSAEEALAVLKEKTFDMALLDIRMPGISGMELLKTMRQHYPSISVVMTTAVNDASTAVEAMKLGASDYIVKPFTVEALRDRINLVLSGRDPETGAMESTGQRQNNPFREQLDAIASGVEEHIDRLDFHRKMVTEQTIDVARRLGLPEKEINEWAADRQGHNPIRIMQKEIH